MDFVQTILTLDRTWPCRRTRWWMLMKPVEYRIHAIPDLPEDQLLRQIRQLMPNWPFWSLDHEEALQLTEYELMIMQDQRYGNDLRQLTRQDVMPCFLHSYSTALQACPCGCRETGFNPQRQLRDGVRGFYIVSMLTGKHRWLHPREAALFCGLDPKMQLPDDLRAGLCLVGKCASPLQAAWMSAHLLDALHAGRGTPQKSLILCISQHLCNWWMKRKALRSSWAWVASRQLQMCWRRNEDFKVEVPCGVLWTCMASFPMTMTSLMER